MAETRGLVVKRIGAVLSTWSARRRLFLALVVAVLVLDQLTKFWALGTLTSAFGAGADGGLGWGEELRCFLWLTHPAASGSVVVSDDFWRFSYVENSGAAFSFLASVGAAWFRRPFLLLVSLVAMVFIVVYYRRTTTRQLALRIALALVFGGALGNFLDRVRLGYVIDFIVWHWYDKAEWPTFNIADAAISVGVTLMVLDMLFAPKVKAEVRSSAKIKGA